ncbi:AAA family ATPase [Candidatus Kaiserbacteria bacterium]|nr:MAG: AAA family ATPase [Candidatus Kaiserbacteria bacterium]
MKESWKPVEESVNKKEIVTRENLSSATDLDLPDDLRVFLTETITNDVDFSVEENALIELRLKNVKEAARAFHVFDKRVVALKDAKLKFEERFPINSALNRPPQVIEAMKKINTEIEGVETSIAELMWSNPEAYIVRNALELREYRKELKSGDFVLTPYAEKKLDELQDNYYAIDKIPFLNGETGSGKSSVAKYFCSEVLSVEPERIAGAKGIDETKIFGKIDLTSDERGPQANFVLGPLYRAMDQGIPLIIEEVNAIPPEILKSLNDIIINAKRGEEVPVIGDPKGTKMIARPGFGVIMTGNLNRNPKAIDRYKGLFELSADFVNRIRPIDYDYLPQATEGTYQETAERGNELYTLMIAMLMNDKGDVNAPEDAFDDLWRLAKFIRKVQEVYSGQRDGKLFSGQAGLNVPLTATSSVVSMRDVKQVIESWKRDNFENEFDFYIYKELIAPLTNAMDVKFFVQQLQAEGFLTDASWKEAVAKAGTFDSAIHTPENKGRDLQFTTVREVVENVYGKAPERNEFPYDFERIKKSEYTILKLENNIRTLQKFVSAEGVSSDLKTSLAPVLEYGNESLSKIKELVFKLRKHLKNGEKEEINTTTDLLNETEEQLLQSTFSEVVKALDDPGKYDSVEQAVASVERVIESEKNLFPSIAATYTEKFKINEAFVKYHTDFLHQLEEDFGSELHNVKEVLGQRLELRVRVALGDKDAQSKLDEGFSKFIEFTKERRERELYCGTPDFPNLKPGTDSKTLQPRTGRSMINRGSQFTAFDMDEKESQEFKKLKMSLDPEVEQVFEQAAHIFKNKSSFEFNQYYGADWREDQRLPAYTVSIDKLKELLSDFIFTEPWMIKLFIYYEERWRDNEHLEKSFGSMYADDPVLFCIKLKSDENVLISVKRIGDQEWKVSKVNGSFSTHRFVAPQIARGY